VGCFILLYTRVSSPIRTVTHKITYPPTQLLLLTPNLKNFHITAMHPTISQNIKQGQGPSPLSDNTTYRRELIIREEARRCRGFRDVNSFGGHKVTQALEPRQAAEDIVRWMWHYFVDNPPKEAMRFQNIRLSFKLEFALSTEQLQQLQCFARSFVQSGPFRRPAMYVGILPLQYLTQASHFAPQTCCYLSHGV